MTLKILTYNVNGIRAALTKNLLGMLEKQNPDIVCFQEIKALPEQIDDSVFEHLGYKCFWYSAQKKGYSGTGILTKINANDITYGCNHVLYDGEGRVIRANFDDFSVISVYFSSGSSGDERQIIKMNFLDYFYHYILELRKEVRNLIICGDYNICHKPIDIHDPIGNNNSSGFLPEEREWMSAFFKSGFTDTFRYLHPTATKKYTWWSFRANARNNNKGWRIDYISASNEIANFIKKAEILPFEFQSDHCPYFIEIEI